MLKFLRKKGVMKKFLWVVAIGIIVMFGFGGQAYLLKNRGQNIYAGKIFGKTISIEEYEKNFKQTHIQTMIRYGADYNKIRGYLNLDSETWDRIILLHEARKRGIKITDQDVIKLVQSYGFFQREGHFDRTLYQDILQYGFKIKSRDFEEGIRDSLKLVRLFDQVTRDVTVSDQDILNAYKLENEKVQVSYALFGPEKHKDKIVFDEIQAKNYYLSHKNEFLLPPSVNVDYISIEVPEDATDEEKESAETKAYAIIEELSENPDLSLVAKKYGLEKKTSGFFNMNQPNLEIGWSYPILQKIFSMQLNEISDVMASPKGFQILKLTERKDAHIPEYESAKNKVKEAWIKSQAKVFAKKEAQQRLEDILKEADKYKRPDFSQIAKNLNIEIHQTPVFARGQYLPSIGIAKDFQDAAFSLNQENKISGVVETSKGYCILHLDESIPIDGDEYKKIKEDFSAKILMQKKNSVFSDFVSQLKARANLDNNIARLMAKK